MIETYIVLTLLFTHWIADFLFQTDEMAINKSKHNGWLFVHVLTYTSIFLAPLLATRGFTGVGNMYFLGITFLCHFITDYFTSRLSSKLWKEDKRHWFFVVIGFDQFSHYLQLLLTYEFVFKHFHQ